jgi:menaquinone-dependent protoporphyrinogen oxidase
MSPRVLVIFGTSYGQTQKIAFRIAATLQRRGCAVELCNAASERVALPLEQYTAVVVGCSIIAKGHQPAIERFVRENAATLNNIPSAFFQVSASAGSKDEKGRMAAQRLLEEFIRRHEWMPVLSASIAGAINYTRYNFLLRWYMKRASAKHGGTTDTSRDHEYTDWAQVDRFALAIANTISPFVERVPEPVLNVG